MKTIIALMLTALFANPALAGGQYGVGLFQTGAEHPFSYVRANLTSAAKMSAAEAKRDAELLNARHNHGSNPVEARVVRFAPSG